MKNIVKFSDFLINHVKNFQCTALPISRRSEISKNLSQLAHFKITTTKYVGNNLPVMTVSNFLQTKPFGKICIKQNDIFNRDSGILKIKAFSRIAKTYFSSSTINFCENRDKEGSQGNSDVGKQLGSIPAYLEIQYMCKVCGTRNQQHFSKQSYEKGVVIVKCSGCKNLHLIADNLGWFKDIGKRNIEEILAEKGETVRRLDASNIQKKIEETGEEANQSFSDSGVAEFTVNENVKKD